MSLNLNVLETICVNGSENGTFSSHFSYTVMVNKVWSPPQILGNPSKVLQPRVSDFSKIHPTICYIACAQKACAQISSAKEACAKKRVLKLRALKKDTLKKYALKKSIRSIGVRSKSER